MINFENYKSILCLNGSLPSANFFRFGLPIIAADGAANILHAMHIRPQIVIGDLDSVHVDLLNQFPTFYHLDQNYCDFQKACFYLEENNLLPTIIVGANGGELDHILNNINIFLQLPPNSILYAPPFIGFVLQKTQQRNIICPIQTKISILGVPEATVNTQGLQWELDHYELAFPGKTSCFNRTVNEEIKISVINGTVLILIDYDGIL